MHIRNRHTIKLPALPNNWNRLSTKELEEVQKLYVLRENEQMKVGSKSAEIKFKARCCWLFLNLRVRKKTTNVNGETVFLFRRRGFRHLFETIPLTAWQVTMQISEHLEFMNDQFGRFVSPYDLVYLFGKRFKAPSDLMTNITYKQYSDAQNLLVKFWEADGVVRFLIGKKRSSKSIREAMKRSRKIQCKFLATLFNVASRQSEVRTEFSVRKVDRKVWAFDSRQINNWRYFWFASKRMFPVMLQFFQSVQTYYSRIYPELFTNKGGDGPDRKTVNYLAMEVNTMNSIMKYSGFKSYQDIYDSNAVFILGVLNNMNKEARAIEEMNAKTAARQK